MVSDDSDNNTISYLSNQDYYGTDTFKYKMCRPRDMVSSEEWEDIYMDNPSSYCGDDQHFHIWLADDPYEFGDNDLCSAMYCGDRTDNGTCTIIAAWQLGAPITPEQCCNLWYKNKSISAQNEEDILSWI